MAHDFQFERGASFGEWLHAQMREAMTFEDAAWAVDRIRRVEGRLQASRLAANRLTVEIPWMDEVNAFTAPGATSISPVAFTKFVLPMNRSPSLWLMRLLITISTTSLSSMAGRIRSLGFLELHCSPCSFTAWSVWFMGQKECDADRHGLDLCISAGYEGLRCLELFDILEQHALNVGDLDMVYGPDAESDDELDENASWTTKAQIWAWQKKRGYLPIRDRKQMLRKHFEAKHLGSLSKSSKLPSGGG